MLEKLINHFLLLRFPQIIMEISLMQKLIFMAKKNGADAVKLQLIHLKQ